MDREPHPQGERPPTPTPAAQDRLADWDDSSRHVTAQIAMAEASRCLQCPDAPCAAACPVQPAIPAALGQTARGDFRAAAVTFEATNPLAAICGRLCPQERLCEGACRFAQPAVAIGALEAFVTESRYTTAATTESPLRTETGKRVAVVGAGPAGLTVAGMLRRSGHAVTVYERRSGPGGTLSYGIPAFRLRRNLVQEQVTRLELQGVRFVYDVCVGKDVSLDDLFVCGFAAVFLGPGASEAIPARLPGAALTGVWTVSDFLQRAGPSDWEPGARGASPKTLAGDHVVVVGDDDAAVDCARSAARLGAATAILVCSSSAAELRCPRRDLVRAMEEGCWFLFGAVAVRLVGDSSDHIRAVVCRQVDSRRSQARGRHPAPAGYTATLRASLVVLSTAYRPDPRLARQAIGLHTDVHDRIVIDRKGATTLPGVFAGGDGVRGADLVVTAVADGLRAAGAIDAYLHGQGAAAPASREYPA